MFNTIQFIINHTLWPAGFNKEKFINEGYCIIKDVLSKKQLSDFNKDIDNLLIPYNDQNLSQEN